MDQKEESEHNHNKFMELLAKVDPELWRIKRELEETGLNPGIVVPHLKAIYQVAKTTRHGVVATYIADGKITNIEPTSKMKLGISALLEEFVNP